MIEAGFNYFTQNKLYIWKRRKNKIDKGKEFETEEGNRKREMLEIEVRLGGNKLRDLAWSLDVLDINKHENIR